LQPETEWGMMKEKEVKEGFIHEKIIVGGRL
jgi:hypothetical protein